MSLLLFFLFIPLQEEPNQQHLEQINSYHFQLQLITIKMTLIIIINQDSIKNNQASIKS